MKCDIIIPVWNQPDITKSCIEHIRNNTSYPYRLILIDNASDIATKEFLKEVKKSDPSTILIRNETNLGFVKAVNQGMRVSDAPYICIMNNDTTAAPFWLEELVRFAESHPDVGIMNPLCGAPPEYTLDSYADLIRKDTGKYMEMNQCFLFCALVKRDVVKKIGYLDEAFGMGGYDDTDYSRRAFEAGYRCASVHSSYVRHLNGVSFKALGKRNVINAENEKIYFDKWPRHLRIAIALSVNSKTSPEDMERVLAAMLLLARDWCWINLWIFGDKTRSRKLVENASEKIGIPSHQNIKISYGGPFKRSVSILRILERSFGTKRRKKYDIILSDDRILSSLCRLLSPIHGATVCDIGRGADTGLIKSALQKARAR
jgi:GT2 family glycosyltransferase